MDPQNPLVDEKKADSSIYRSRRAKKLGGLVHLGSYILVGFWDLIGQLFRDEISCGLI